MPQLIWSPQARTNLQDIWSYYAKEASLEVADQVLERIAKSCELLLRFPERGRRCDELLDGARFLVVGPHLAFYRINGENVEVLHVLHGKQDRERLREDDEKS